MCEFCHMTFCPPLCPNGERSYDRICPRCELPLYEGEGITAPDGVTYCEECISEMDMYEILQICEIDDVVSLIKALNEKQKGF